MVFTHCCIFSNMQPLVMDRLYTFLSLLTTGMHEACPGSKVIWYDSVTVDGNLKWQNSLNKMNQSVDPCLTYMYSHFHMSDGVREALCVCKSYMCALE